MLRPIAFAATIFSIASLLVGCGGGGGGTGGGITPPPTAQPTSTATPVAGPSQTAKVGSSPTAFTLVANGIKASATIPAVSSGSGSALTATLSTTPPTGVAAPQSRHHQLTAHAAVAFVTFTASSSITFSGTLSASITLPQGSTTQPYFLAMYIPGLGWQYEVAGPSTPNSSGVVSFTVQIPSSAPVTIAAGATYVLALTTDASYTTISVSFPIAPQAVAAQIGEQSWQSVNVSGSTMTLNLPPNTKTYGVAYVCPMVNSITQEFIIQSATADGTTLNAPCPLPTAAPPVAYVSGTYDASALPSANMATIAIGTAYSFGSQNPGSPGTFSGAYSTGTADIVALAEAAYSVVGAKIIRGQTITNNETLTIPPFAASDATTTENILFPTSSQSFLSEIVKYITSGGTIAQVSNPENQTTYAAIPASEAQNGDYYDSRFQAQRLLLTMMETVTYETTFTSPQSISVVAPSNPQFFAVGATKIPSFNFDNADVMQNQHVYDAANVSYTGFSITALLSSGWMGSATSYALPDLSGIARFAGLPSSGADVSWAQSSISSTTPVSPLSTGVPNSFIVQPTPLPPNATVQTIGSSGNYSVP